MNIFEVWDELEKLQEAENETKDPVDELLAKIPCIVLDYSSFTREYAQDHFDPRHGHYQTSKDYLWPEFEYEVDTVSMFETVRDDIIPDYINKVKPSLSKYKYNTSFTKSLATLDTELKNLYTTYKNASPETEAEACQALELFIAQNLESIVILFENWIKEYYAEDAEEWAENNLDSMDPRDYFAPEYDPSDDY